MRVRLLACITLLLSVPLSGCFDQDTRPVPEFDGDGAYAFVEGLVTDDTGAPRYRNPGSEGHADAAAWLWDNMDASGWQRGWQNFTGADYQALQSPLVSRYTQPGACPDEDAEEVSEHTFSNIWARRDATGGATGRTLLLAAHWDSKEDASNGGPMLGANDGASGVGVLLQLMQHIAEGILDPAVDIVVAFFDGEDGFEDCHPLAGSILFAAHEPAGRIDRMILLDMVGDLNARFVREEQSQESDPALMDLLWRHGRAQGGAEQFTDQEKAVIDDHVPFLDAGVRAVDIIDFGRSGGDKFGFPPYWHTSGDTMQNIDARMLEIVGNTLWATLGDPAFVDSWP